LRCSQSHIELHFDAENVSSWKLYAQAREWWEKFNRGALSLKMEQRGGIAAKRSVSMHFLQLRALEHAVKSSTGF
jgi:hypothetical protein